MRSLRVKTLPENSCKPLQNMDLILQVVTYVVHFTCGSSPIDFSGTVHTYTKVTHMHVIEGQKGLQIFQTNIGE